MNRYFYIDNEGKQKGTFSPEELSREGIKRDTLVWTQGMGQWKRADETEELQYLFSESYSSPQPQVVSGEPQTGYERSFGNTGQQVQQSMPKTWLVESILVTILPFMLCSSVFSLLGILAIVYAAQVESFYNRGDYIASLESSRSARKWTKIALWIAIGWILLIVLLIVLLLVIAGSITNLPGIVDGLLDA